MKHLASPRFRDYYVQLPGPARQLADECFELLKKNHHHASLHFKKIGRYGSVRVDLQHPALARRIPDGLLWFWIGTHVTTIDS